MAFTKATKKQRALKMALFGTSGSGKTFTALTIASAFTGGVKIALIDTERSSASLYADRFDFDTAPLTSYGVDDFVRLINEAAAGGYEFIIIDSISHAWEAKGGILEEVELIKRRKGYKDGMRAWGDVKEVENRLWDAILDCPCSVIVTMRAKTAYEVSKDEKGKTSIEKLGLAPVQRADKEYEFDVVARMDPDNTMIITKTRCGALVEGVYPKPNGKVSGILKEWLQSGEASQPAQSQAPTPAQIVLRNVESMGFPNADVTDLLKNLYKVKKFGELTEAQQSALADDIQKRAGIYGQLKAAMDTPQAVAAFLLEAAQAEYDGKPLRADAAKWEQWAQGVQVF